VIVLDTHAWIWWKSEPRLLSRRARTAIETADRIGISALSCYEVGRLVARGRLFVARSLRSWIAQALTGVEPIAVTPEVALAAAMLDDLPGDPVDRILYATAVDADAQLVTKDEALRRFDRARTIW
jgi:PIN domain nuclease of toxin-antitoxin system